MLLLLLFVVVDAAAAAATTTTTTTSIVNYMISSQLFKTTDSSLNFAAYAAILSSRIT